MPRCPECEPSSKVTRDWKRKCWRCYGCGFTYTRRFGEIREVDIDDEEVKA